MHNQKHQNCCENDKPEISFSDLLSEEDNNILNRHKSCSVYKKGQTIFNEGNAPYGLYFLYEGKIKLWRDTVAGKEMIIRIIKDGEIFGHRSLLSNSHYKASATTLEDSVVCFYFKEDFVEVMNRNSMVAQHLLRLVAREMGTIEENIGSVAHKTIRERIAENLLSLNSSFGLNQEEKIIIDLSLSRQELADIIGTTREQITLFLSEFKKEGIITLTQNKKIQILNLEKLMKISNMYCL